MTIAIGFTCADGLLICADTELTMSGVSKVHGSKIFREEYANGAKSAIAVAGALNFARMAMQHIEWRIANSKPKNLTVWAIRTLIESELRDMYHNYIDPHPDRNNVLFGLLLAVWSPIENRAVIFWSDDTAVNELRGYLPMGVGESIAHFVIKEEGYIHTMKSAEVRPIALKAISKAKYCVPGCGGFTDMVFLGRDGVLGTIERLSMSTGP